MPQLPVFELLVVGVQMRNTHAPCIRNQSHPQTSHSMDTPCKKVTLQYFHWPWYTDAHLCMSECIYACIHACMYGWMDGCMYLCMHVSMDVCMICIDVSLADTVRMSHTLAVGILDCHLQIANRDSAVPLRSPSNCLFEEFDD